MSAKGYARKTLQLKVLEPGKRYQQTIVLKEQRGLADGESWSSATTGMEFVWVQALGLWVGKYEVTNGEYRKKEPAHNSKEFDGHSLNGDRQPVVYVNSDDAKAYAVWLMERDRASGQLPSAYRYRLPSEKEWLMFAQCGDGRESPWGNSWPPRMGQAGNYSDSSSACRRKIDGYRDGHAVTCDVEDSWRNPWGLYGVGGNVWECCAKGSLGSLGSSFGAWRGASWGNYYQGRLCCTYRSTRNVSYRDLYYGFRLVLSR